ncbi:dna repair protein [Rutstroemia sp. NJR-2017a BBW]|nr:dna repair protein [Rutstroemia sp. NJR-2017a BBW]
MPSQFFPKRSNRHRIAWPFSNNAPASPSPLNCSPQDLLVIDALKRGYEAEQLLRTAGDGDSSSRSKIYELLKHRLDIANASRQIPRSPKPEIRYPEAIPGAPKLLNVRPLPLEKLSGRRHVPIFASTSCNNFLRIQKPQSPYLSRVLRDKYQQRQTRQAAREKIAELRVLAAQENQWEYIVSKQMEEEGLSVHDWQKKQPGLLDWGANTWELDLRKAEAGLTAALNEEQMKAVELSRRQLELVEEERELWRKEKADRRREKRLAKTAKKEAGENKAMANSKTELV